MRSKKELDELNKFLTVNPNLDLQKKICQQMGIPIIAPITYRIPYNDRVDLWVLVSNYCGWEHVSISCLTSGTMNPITRTPKWAEMEFIKEKFWKDDEWVVQFHPAKEDYVNHHPYVLHLWRPIDENLPHPPKNLV